MDGASISSSVLNLINNVVGAGLFSMPWCLKEATVLTGCSVFVFMCGLNVFSFGLLAESCELTNKFSFLGLGQAAIGRGFGTGCQVRREGTTSPYHRDRDATTIHLPHEQTYPLLLMCRSRSRRFSTLAARWYLTSFSPGTAWWAKGRGCCRCGLEKTPSSAVGHFSPGQPLSIPWGSLCSSQ